MQYVPGVENYRKMYHEMVNLKCIKLSGYDLDPEIKPPKHGPYTTVFDKKRLKKTLKFVSEKCVTKKYS